MRNYRNLLALGIVAIMSVALVGCSSDKDKDDDDKKSKVSAEKVLEDIPTEDMNNFTANIKMVFDAEIEAEETMEMNLTFDIDMEYDNILSYIDMTMKGDMMGTENNMAMEMYIGEDENGTPIIYSNQDGTWYYQAMDDVGESLDATQPAAFTDYIKDADIVDEDKNKYVIECVIDFAKLYEDQSEAFEDVDSEYKDMISDMMVSFEEMEITYEIDKDTNNILAVDIELTKAIDDLFDVLTELSEGEMNFSEMIKVNEFSIKMEYDNYGDAEVEIPDDVIDNAQDGTLVGGTEIGGAVVDEDAVDIHGDEINVYDYSTEEYITTITLPDGFSLREEDYFDRYWFAFQDDNSNTFYVDCGANNDVEDYLNGEYESNTEDYTRDEMVEFDLIETNQGTVRAFANIWCMSENPETDYFIDYYFILWFNDDSCAQISYNAYSTDSSDYTLEQLETIVKEIFQ